MRTRLTRATILALLLLALAPGAALASCLQATPGDCCCAGCPDTEKTSLDAMPCCGMTEGDAAPLPTQPAVAPTSPETLAAACTSTLLLVDEFASTQIERSVPVDEDPPAAVPLFTLHAAFLI